MAKKPLSFIFDGREITFGIEKIGREKLYGYRDVEAVTDNEQLCEMATLAGDGRTVVGRGGTSLGYLTADREWTDKKELKPVGSDHHEIKPVSSSFGAPIELSNKVSADRYFEHNIRSIYLLESEEMDDALLAELTKGEVFEFEFSYRGGLEPDNAFLLMNEENELFMALGKPTEIEFVGLQETAGLSTEDEATEDEDDDLMDFDMM